MGEEDGQGGLTGALPVLHAAPFNRTRSTRPSSCCLRATWARLHLEKRRPSRKSHVLLSEPHASSVICQLSTRLRRAAAEQPPLPARDARHLERGGDGGAAALPRPPC